MNEDDISMISLGDCPEAGLAADHDTHRRLLEAPPPAALSIEA